MPFWFPFNQILQTTTIVSEWQSDSKNIATGKGSGESKEKWRQTDCPCSWFRRSFGREKWNQCCKWNRGILFILEKNCLWLLVNKHSNDFQRRSLNAKNAEYLDRIDKQNLELGNISSKYREQLAIQAILNEEVNEKTEEICQLHSEKSKWVYSSSNRSELPEKKNSKKKHCSFQ